MTEKREFESDQALLQSMKLKLAHDELAVKFQGDGVVIHEEPQIAQAPVSPNVPMVLALGTAAGILISPLLALAVMLALHRLNPRRSSVPPALPGLR